MQTERFFAEVPSIFPGDPQVTDPIDPRWVEITEKVDGFTSPNELAMVNLAARLLPADEAYLEVGTFKGRSIVAAAADNHDARMYAIENFMEFGMAGQVARAELFDNLDRHADGAKVTLLEGDAFALMGKPGVIDRPVGVYFYDGEHTLLAHYLALAVVEPLLADEALVLVDDATWPVVQRAHRLFLKNHPGWEIAATWDAATNDDPRWANGLHALVFRRQPGEAARESSATAALRRWQTGPQRHLNTAAWRMAERMPGVAKRAAKLVMSRSRAI